MNILGKKIGDAQVFETAPARLTINLDAIVENWRRLCRMTPAARTSAVVKADAYGLGVTVISRALAKAGCRDFFVATPDEGVNLRRELPDARIIVLSGLWPGMEKLFIDNQLVPAVASLEQLHVLGQVVPVLPFALNIDTGMNRLGVTASEAIELAAGGARPVMVMSHLACSDEPDHPMNRHQLESFQALLPHFKGVESSLSSSAGIMLGPDYHFDLTRPGIALYGGEAICGRPNPMLPVVAAEARILQIRTAAAGERISYGATHPLERESRLAVVGAGYADGWHRSLSGSGVALRGNGSSGASGFIKGYRAPLLGRVSMDLTIFDITDIPENHVAPGDYIELFGNGITVDEAANSAGTISWELLTSLGKRYVRRYL
jgi:alanine racemase